MRVEPHHAAVAETMGSIKRGFAIRVGITGKTALGPHVQQGLLFVYVEIRISPNLFYESSQTTRDLIF